MLHSHSEPKLHWLKSAPVKFGAFGDTYTLKTGLEAVLCWSFDTSSGGPVGGGDSRPVPCNQVPDPPILCYPILLYSAPVLLYSVHILLYSAPILLHSAPEQFSSYCIVFSFTSLPWMANCTGGVGCQRLPSLYTAPTALYTAYPPLLVNCCPWMGRVPGAPAGPLLLLRSADIYGTCCKSPLNSSSADHIQKCAWKLSSIYWQWGNSRHHEILNFNRIPLYVGQKSLNWKHLHLMLTN